jgi:hypothetical protein
MEQELENVEETQQEESTQEVVESQFDSAGDDSVFKVDLSKPPTTEEEATEEPEAKAEEVVEETVGEVSSEESTETVEKDEVFQALEEITDEEAGEKVEEVKEEIEEALAEAEATGKPLPESVEKLMQFMDETGGDLEDYVRLNQDYDKLDNTNLLREYYKQTKPHLDNEEINFLMEESFSYDEELDEDRDIRKKKIALKEQVAEAKAYLDGQKSKYYEEIKAGSKLTDEQQKAVNFFDRYNKESEETNKAVKRSSDIFEKKTNNLFNDKFKGFEYKVGEKKYRFNVKDVDGVKANQSDINNFMSKFVDESKSLSDAAGYHKALYTAMNADAVANHFYEQGKADALKDSIKKSKNINMDPRQSHKTIDAGGVKVRVLGDDSSDFKFKLNKNRK